MLSKEMTLPTNLLGVTPPTPTSNGIQRNVGLRQMDADGDGTLSREEFAAAMGGR